MEEGEMAVAAALVTWQRLQVAGVDTMKADCKIFEAVGDATLFRGQAKPDGPFMAGDAGMPL